MPNNCTRRFLIPLKAQRPLPLLHIPLNVRTYFGKVDAPGSSLLRLKGDIHNSSKNRHRNDNSATFSKLRIDLTAHVSMARLISIYSENRLVSFGSLCSAPN